MTKKIALVLGMFGFLAMTGVAFAQTVSTTATGQVQTTVTAPSQPMVLQVGPQGRVLLRGTIASVSASSITVTSWGGIWTINIPSTAQVLPQGATLANFQQGDFVGVQGTVNQSGSWTVDATLVRDWTQRQALTQQRQQNIQTVRQQEQSVPRIYQGTVSGLSGQAFTLTTAAGTNYSVSLAAGAKLLQRNWLTLDFTKVQNGDTVRVWGPMSSSSITASIFRDVSVK